APARSPAPPEITHETGLAGELLRSSALHRVFLGKDSADRAFPMRTMTRRDKDGDVEGRTVYDGEVIS
ncbi:hypothetical protein, partial [Bradyrhizobium sp. IC4061]|uniref:hypothetical protein n=3 Tax=unclassified Bradyrhizobium TaxID=2631580 RepID=UPI001CD75730